MTLPPVSPTPALFLHRGGSQIRGSEEALLTLLAQLDRSQFQPTVVCSQPAFAEALRRRGIDARVESFPEILIVPREISVPFVGYLRSIRRLVQICRRMETRIVFCNGGGPCQMAVPLAMLLRLKCLCLLHHPAPRSLHFFWLTRFVDKLVFASQFTASHTQERIGRTGEIVYIGIDPERFAPPPRRDMAVRASYGIAPEAIVFAQIGALVSHKGHDLLLQAFSRISPEIPSARLLIIGAGPESDRVRDLVSSLGLTDRVTLTGYVDDTVPYLQHVIDVNILASSEEGLGLVNLQASACGLPSIGTDATGIRETIIQGRTGFLFSPGDTAALATYMSRLALDPLLRESFGAEGRKFVIDRFSPAVYGSRIQRIIRALLANEMAANVH